MRADLLLRAARRLGGWVGGLGIALAAGAVLVVFGWTAARGGQAVGDDQTA